MADNTVIPAGAGGDTIRDIDRAGIKTQVMQLDMGGASAEVLIVAGQKTMAASMPVVLPSDQTVTVNQGAQNASSSFGWFTMNGESPDTTGTITTATGNVTATALIGYANTSVSVNGTYSGFVGVWEGSDDGGVTYYPVTVAREGMPPVLETTVTLGTNAAQSWQINNPGLDAIRLRATALTSGTVNVRISASSSPTASGTVVGVGYPVQVVGHPASTGQTTSANSLPVVIASDTASGTITTQNLVPAGVATASSAVEITLAGNAALAIQTTGVYTGALSLQATVDGTTWVTLAGTPLININTGGYLAAITSALQSVFQADAAGFIKARITGLAAMTGTATVTLRTMNVSAMVALDAALPPGANIIGAVNIAAAQTLATVTTVSSVTAVASSTPVTPATTFLNAAATTNATSSKGAAGTVWNVLATNFTASAKFVKLYNKATAPTVGTDVPVIVITVPANDSKQIDGGSNGYRFATGIAFAITGAQPDADTTVLAAGDVKLALSFT